MDANQFWSLEAANRLCIQDQGEREEGGEGERDEGTKGIEVEKREGGL